MKILWGIQFFGPKTFTPAELDLEETIKENAKVMVRQRYFHIFFIPFFGMGQQWLIQEKDKVYEPSLSVQRKIDRIARVKGLTSPNPFAYSGSFVAAIFIGLLLYAIIGGVFVRSAYEEQRYEAMISEVQMRHDSVLQIVEKTGLGDSYKFNVVIYTEDDNGQRKRTKSYFPIYLVVTDTSTTQVQFKMYLADVKRKPENRQEQRFLEFTAQQNNEFWVNRTSIKAAIKDKFFRRIDRFSGVEIEEIAPRVYFRLKDIELKEEEVDID